MDLDTLRYYSRWHQHVNQQVYDAPADPWSPIHIDPTTIDSHNQEVRLNWGLGRVEAGDWDNEEACQPLHETVIYEGLVQRFEAGCEWEETSLYERAAARFEDGDSVRGYESLEAYRRVRCGYLDDLFDTICEEGYRPNTASNHVPATSENPFEDAYVHHLEPLVVIDRDGGIHLSEGFHRVILAAIIGVDTIPVQVLCRHSGWQQTRDQLSETPRSELSTENLNRLGHPDLQGVEV